MKLMQPIRIVSAAVALTFLVQTPSSTAASFLDPDLPSVASLKDYKPKIPLRVYTSDGALIGEFGNEHREVVSISQVPPLMIKAILAAEDDRFYEHHGVDFMGVARAAIADVLSGSKKQGASTITMQVARNFFLSKEKTFSRKFDEMLLAMKIEDTYSKDQILEFYINQIYLGERAYGFQAAAQTYFGKDLKQLDLAEMAVLAGLPKGPSIYNPIASLARAKIRQHYVLGRMRTLKYITEAQYEHALREPITVRRTEYNNVDAEYVAEMVRQQMHTQYGDSIYTSGMKVYTTLRLNDQKAADEAVYNGVTAYDHRHGYRGPEGYVKDMSPKSLNDDLGNIPVVNHLVPAVVLSASPRKVTAWLQGGETIEITGNNLAFVKKSLKGGTAGIRRGAVIRVVRSGKSWQITQVPQVASAFVALDPRTGAVLALVGGFDFSRTQFNHVTQAWRQPGSSFKPFIYSAALEKGYGPGSVFLDAPLSIPDGTGGVWQPKDYENDFLGPMRLRDALAHSRNLPTIRLLLAITPQYAQSYVSRFGFTPDRWPAYPTMALGVGTATPMQMAQAYSVFANGGFMVTPSYIDHVVDASGKVLFQWRPVDITASGAPRVIDARNAYVITSMLQGVVRYGTGAAAAKLGRSDLAGKTGTTNDQADGWFCGYNPQLVAVSWMGFDQPKPMGHGEAGAETALPIWIDFMGQALKNVPEQVMPMPPGLVTVRIDRTTGQPTGSDQNSIDELFYQEFAPGHTSAPTAPAVPATPASPAPVAPAAIPATPGQRSVTPAQ